MQTEDVQVAISEAETIHMRMLKSSSKLEPLLLTSIALEHMYTKQSEVTMEKTYSRMSLLGMPERVSFAVVSVTAAELVRRGYIKHINRYSRLYSKLELNVSLRDLTCVLRSYPGLEHLAGVLQTVEGQGAAGASEGGERIIVEF